jgi:endonuclease/exonuclease/phosphatase family metal-dependent hydrolase
LLAGRIREAGYDLILLTEVFSGRARRMLVDRLAGEYQWNVQYIGSHRILREDSGLMLLSRLPFEALPDSRDCSHPKIRASSSGSTPDWQHVWFVEYRDCCSSDCLAGKGAAYVRVRLDGRPLNVFFTHMQAKYDYHGPRKQALTREIRLSQLRQLAGLVEEALGPDGNSSENTIVLGDFNVDGVRSSEDHPAAGADGDEWRSMLELMTGLFPQGVDDVWDRYTPTADPGHTYPAWDPHARRDYVFLSSTDPAQPLRVQHTALAYNLAGRDGQVDRNMSDHLGINVDLNLEQAGCHPQDARPLGQVAESVAVEGRIEHAGGLQWYALEARGAFEIEHGFDEGGASHALEVYSAADISRPLSPVAVSSSAKRYAMSGESLIRVGDPRSSLSGAFSLSVEPR